MGCCDSHIADNSVDVVKQNNIAKKDNTQQLQVNAGEYIDGKQKYSEYAKYVANPVIPKRNYKKPMTTHQINTQKSGNEKNYKTMNYDDLSVM